MSENDGAAVAGPEVYVAPDVSHPAGSVHRYPVDQPDGSTRHQLILVTGHDDDGKVRGVPLGYEDTAAAFNPDQLA